MKSTGATAPAAAAGAFVALALVAGGTSLPYLAGDALVQLAALPMLAWLWFGGRVPAGNVLTPIAAACVLGVAVQLLPNPIVPGQLLLAADAGRAFHALVQVTALAVFFLYLSALNAAELRFIAEMLVWLCGCAILLALIQFARPGTDIAFGLSPAGVRAAFFANANHFATFVAACLPLAMATVLRRRAARAAYALVFCVLLFQLTVGSNAGVVLAGLSASLAIWAFVPRRRPLVLAMLAVIAAITLAWFLGQAVRQEVAGDLNRIVFARNTLAAIADHLPFGAGFGSFTAVYPAYETASGIFREYVNRAHNDYLEGLLEGGVVFLALVGAYIAALVRLVRAGPMSRTGQAALIGIAVILAHSLVDYPLRTSAIAVVFVLLNAVLVSESAADGEAAAAGRTP